jgi:uncharacterized protein YbaR (Trm112 family)
MSIDKRLLDVLCCPISKVPLAPLSRAQLAELNRHIASGSALRVNGDKVGEALAEGLITTDGKVIYRIDDGVPVLLADEGIGTTQFQDFPR